jgi:hypothetical protein
MQPEARLRARCAMFLRTCAPGLKFTAIEHGRKHTGTAEQRAREWQALAAQGLRQGLGDMLLMPPHSPGLWVELKHGANKQTPAQRAMQDDMEAIGWGYVVCRSVEALGHQLALRGIPLAIGWQITAMRHDALLDGDAPRRTPAKPRAVKATRKQVAKANALMLGMAGR